MASKRLAEAVAPPELRIGTHWRPRDDEASPASKPKSQTAQERKHKALRFGRSTSKGATSQDAS